MKQTYKQELVKFLKGWAFPILVSLLIATSIKSAIADWNIVPTGSMKPTIMEGDFVFVNKLAYDLKIPYSTVHIAEWGDPQKGDIVVFYSPKDNKRLIKRVTAGPGDEIALQNNILIINGEPLAYRPITDSSFKDFMAQYIYLENLNGHNHPMMVSSGLTAYRSFPPIIVPDGKYFMMGDNRDNSADSRFFGFVDRDQIVGHALYVAISLDKNHFYRPRWDRFFTKLP